MSNVFKKYILHNSCIYQVAQWYTLISLGKQCIEKVLQVCLLTNMPWLKLDLCRPLHTGK